MRLEHSYNTAVNPGGAPPAGAGVAASAGAGVGVAGGTAAIGALDRSFVCCVVCVCVGCDVHTHIYMYVHTWHTHASPEGPVVLFLTTTRATMVGCITATRASSCLQTE